MTLQTMLMFMSRSFHLDGICDFNQFMIHLHDFLVNVIVWDVDSLLRDSHFLHIKYFNPQKRKFNFTIELSPLHPTSSKFVICNVEVKKSHSHENMDCGQPVNATYNMDLSLINLPCQSFPKGCFHDPIVESLE